MKLSVAKRHHIKDQESFEELQAQEANLAQIAELSAPRPEISLRLSVSTPEPPRGEEREQIEGLLASCSSAGWIVDYSTDNTSAGEKFVRQLFERQDSIQSLCCLDQFPLHKEEYFEAFIEMARRVEKEQTFYGVGARNVPVRLGVHEHPHKLRVAHELIHSLTGKDIFVTPTHPGISVSPEYEAFGESTSGAYFINPESKPYAQIRKYILEQKDMWIKPGSSIEYLTALLSAQHKSVSTGYVQAVENPYSNIAYEVELAKAHKLIFNSTLDLAGTPIKPLLQKTLESSYKKLEEYLPALVVEETAELMRRALQ